jgi:hypothetical protein
MPTPNKRPRDPIQLAKLIGDIAIGEVEDVISEKKKKPPSRGRLGGLKGGTARAKKLTSKQRVEIARIAANARWKKSR